MIANSASRLGTPWQRLIICAPVVETLSTTFWGRELVVWNHAPRLRKGVLGHEMSEGVI